MAQAAGIQRRSPTHPRIPYHKAFICGPKLYTGIRKPSRSSNSGPASVARALVAIAAGAVAPLLLLLLLLLLLPPPPLLMLLLLLLLLPPPPMLLLLLPPLPPPLSLHLVF